MALLDILALLDATSIYRGAIIHIGNAPATSDGPSRSSCLCFVIERDGVKLMTRRIARCGSCWHPLWRSRLAPLNQATTGVTLETPIDQMA
jgi:hypothetical protein